jgi:hypothetical protein
MPPMRCAKLLHVSVPGINAWTRLKIDARRKTHHGGDRKSESAGRTRPTARRRLGEQAAVFDVELDDAEDRANRPHPLPLGPLRSRGRSELARRGGGRDASRPQTSPWCRRVLPRQTLAVLDRASHEPAVPRMHCSPGPIQPPVPVVLWPRERPVRGVPALTWERGLRPGDRAGCGHGSADAFGAQGCDRRPVAFRAVGPAVSNSSIIRSRASGTRSGGNLVGKPLTVVRIHHLRCTISALPRAWPNGRNRMTQHTRTKSDPPGIRREVAKYLWCA